MKQPETDNRKGHDMSPVNTAPDKPVRVLLIDDDPVQHLLLRNLLSIPANPPFQCRMAGTLQEGWDLLTAADVDILILDLGLPGCQGTEAFTRTHTRFPDLPIVVLTGQDDEALGLSLVHKGAQDYLVKGQVSAALLGRTLRYAIERQRLMLELQRALAEIKTLNGLLPICAHCKKIRDDKGYWTRLEQYIEDRSAAQFTHGICPECIKTLYPDITDKVLDEPPPARKS
jgi:sigma-B regulation protein RsbU (phosphoserine phosphatase)